jgi:hypothetical protein
LGYGMAAFLAAGHGRRLWQPRRGACCAATGGYMSAPDPTASEILGNLSRVARELGLGSVYVNNVGASWHGPAALIVSALKLQVRAWQRRPGLLSQSRSPAGPGPVRRCGSPSTYCSTTLLAPQGRGPIGPVT